MYRRAGLERFKKAQSSEPFSVSINLSANRRPQTETKPGIHPTVANSYSQTSHQLHRYQHPLPQRPQHVPPKPSSDAAPSGSPALQVTQVGGSQSAWKPPDWAIEPRPCVNYLEVLKDGQVLDRVSLDKRRHIIGRQFPMCDFVLDHPSISRQHAALVPHEGGRSVL
ncbi:hypothetical protein Droror1_Dr00005522 [Drosera rotundifolia]